MVSPCWLFTGLGTDPPAPRAHQPPISPGTCPRAWAAQHPVRCPGDVRLGWRTPGGSECPSHPQGPKREAAGGQPQASGLRSLWSLLPVDTLESSRDARPRHSSAQGQSAGPRGTAEVGPPCPRGRGRTEEAPRGVSSGTGLGGLRAPRGAGYEAEGGGKGRGCAREQTRPDPPPWGLPPGPEATRCPRAPPGAQPWGRPCLGHGVRWNFSSAT